MLFPKKVKYRKQQKGRIKGKEGRVTELAFGSFGLKCLEAKRITSKQLEAARRTILRYFKKGGKLWLRIFPDHSVTSKGTEFSMGGGKGDVAYYCFLAKPGRIILEVDGIKEEVAIEALKQAAAKLPVKTKIVKK
jgi:large subunit ribosomal protein L16